MQIAPLPTNEAERLCALYAYQVLDTDSETAFDDLTTLATKICDTPIALITFIDSERQWFKSKVGLEATETSRDVAFCSHAILQSEVLIVPDARKDDRFADNPAVVGFPYVRFYAGAPLVTPAGYRLGTLCVVDHQPKELRPAQIEALQALSRQAIAQLELRLKVASLEQKTQEAQRSEALSRESEARFRVIADSTTVLIRIEDDHQQSVFFNQAWLDFTGQSLEQARQTNWQANIHPDDFDLWLRTYSTAFQAKASYNVEFRLKRTDGLYRWLIETGAPRFLPNGSFTGYTGSCTDITEHKQAEEDLHLMQSMTRAIFTAQDFDSALAIVLQKVCEAALWDFGEAWIPSHQKNCMECSSAWYSPTDRLTEFRQISETLSFPPGVGIPGRIWVSRQPEWYPDISLEGSAVYLRVNAAVNAGLKATLGIPIVVDDEVLAVLVFYMHQAKEEDERLIALISASTELGLYIQQKRIEEEIWKSLQKERELNELKSTFVSTVSHEFRTPLSTIMLATEFLESYEQRITPEKRLVHLQRIKISTDRMKQMLEDVLLINQGEVGKLKFEPAPIDLNAFCQTLVEEFRVSASSSHTLILNCQDDLTNACMDANLLNHIFGNLLSNAIKYSPLGGTIHFEIRAAEESVIFQVRDSGVGIPIDDQLHLFETFYRATNASPFRGTGLGLAIVKQCVELHQGTIAVESEVDVGTQFTVQLPLGRGL